MDKHDIAAALVVMTAWAGSAAAQPESPWRCDCTAIVDTCSADVVARGSFLEIKTDQAQCARVDYFVDGQPFVSVVVDGEDRQNWLARTSNPRILVQSCQVCRENTSAPSTPAPAAANAPAAGEEAGEAKLEPLIAGVPEFPAAARARGTQGHVDVEFTVNAAGNVENPRVVGSEPRGVFDAAALAAVSRWRYPAEAERAPQTLQERIDFRLPNARSPQARAVAAAPGGPRNECVRQDSVYNYGEMVDVGLVNVCSDPLLVFGCAQGTGRYADRWTCSASEDQGNVLVSTTDRRVGSPATVATAQGARTLRYADAFSVTRAPNSQFLWVACSQEDAECLADARLWTRAVSGQPAAVDPGTRSTVAVARSY
jgi:TonB family protein